MLKRVSIQNFKSLKDVTLDLQKVNLLIGPNNSGKTNFLKALEFMSSKNISNKTSIDIPHNIPFRSMDEEFPSIVEIHLTLTQAFDNREKYVALISTYSNYQIRSWTEDIDYEAVLKSLNNSEKAQGFFVEPEFNNLIIYKIDSRKLEGSYPLLPDNDFINEDSSNIVAYLDTIRDKYPDTFNNIQQDVSICLPEFSQIRFNNTKPTENQRKLYGDKTYKVLGLYEKNLKSTFWADELSEGTLYFLALLCIINQPKPPKLLLIEEPEKGIHPRRIREVMDFIFRLAEEKDVQIILTSHNEHVLDDFATRPEAVFVFDKDEEGATYVRNLQTDIIEPTNRRNQELGLDEIDLTTNLSENWLYGLLGGVPSIP